MKNLRVFLPEISLSQLSEVGLVEGDLLKLQVSVLQKDWQSLFASFVGMKEKSLPWTKLRMAQFDLPSSVYSACCCDPVLMQMTHRGAYMLGQANLQLSQNDAIRIVAQINERIMREGEHLYLVDKHAWLFTSQEPLALSSLTYNELIGKDIFNHSYQGKDGKFWQQRQTEIQMLIKEMTDYQGLPAPSPDTIIDVHFSDLILRDDDPEMPFIKNEALSILSDNELIKTFCLNSLLTHQVITDTDSINHRDICMIAFDNERESYQSIIEFWRSQVESGRLNSCQLVCQDYIIDAKSSAGFFQRFFNFKSSNS